MGKRLAGMFWALVFLAVPVLGVATFAVAPSINVWLPKDVSEHGRQIDSLFYFILVLTGVVFVATEVLLFWFIWKYDAAKQRGPAT
ncbi:MAG: cytochrome c oxidase subunit II, partial [Planctomycetia bacterium]|nr:cytochrome c oxidase subunit II [Planctomycetia bacterium]